MSVTFTHSPPILKAGRCRRRRAQKLLGDLSKHLRFALTEIHGAIQFLRATFDGVAEHGFHLIHAALYGELLGRNDPATVH
jgi:hypothetical protein